MCTVKSPGTRACRDCYIRGCFCSCFHLPVAAGKHQGGMEADRDQYSQFPCLPTPFIHITATVPLLLSPFSRPLEHVGMHSCIQYRTAAAALSPLLVPSAPALSLGVISLVHFKAACCVHCWLQSTPQHLPGKEGTLARKEYKKKIIPQLLASVPESALADGDLNSHRENYLFRVIHKALCKSVLIQAG